MLGEKNFLSSASPMAKMFMAIAITTGLVVVHRYFYDPFVKKQKYRQAEEWADWIIEQEEQGKEGGAYLYEKR